MSRTVSARRLGVLTTTAVLAVSTILVSPAHAASSPSADRAEAWLAGELVDGLLAGPFGGVDTGLSIDAALLAAATGDAATAAEIRDALAPDIELYIAGEQYGDVGSTYINEAAKALAMVGRTGGDPTSFGGVDLVDRVASLTVGGRIEGVGLYSIPANLIGQSFAVDGLHTAGSPVATAARDYLAGLQCSDGSFSLTMPAPGAAPLCGPGDASVDATAFALAALARVPGTPEAVISRTADWLGARAGADGSFGSDAFIETPNANSTGLAAAALGDACRVQAASRSADWLRGVQLTGPDAGAVAYDAATAAAAQTVGAGEDDAARDQFRRATAQAALGLVWDPSATSDLRLSAAGGVLTIDGARADQTVCLTTPTGTTRLTGTGDPLTVPVTVPAGGSATYTATTGPGQAVLTVTAPATPVAPAAPVVTPPVAVPSPAARFGGKRLVRGERRVVRASGLRPGTKVVLRLRDAKVASGRSRADGTVRLRFRVQTRLGPARLVLRVPAAGTKLRSVVRVVR